MLTSPNQEERLKIETSIDLVIKNLDLLIEGKYNQFTEILHSET